MKRQSSAAKTERKKELRGPEGAVNGGGKNRGRRNVSAWPHLRMMERERERESGRGKGIPGNSTPTSVAE